MEYGTKDILTQQDGERDRMIHDKKPSFKSYYKVQLFPVKHYRDTTVCEDTGRVFLERKYWLNLFIGIVIALCIFALAVWGFIAYVSGTSDSYAAQTVKGVLLIFTIGVAERYISPLKYFWVKFKIEEDQYAIEHMHKEIRNLPMRMIRSMIGEGATIAILLLLQLYGVSLRRNFVMNADVMLQIIPMVIITTLVFLSMIVINLYLWKDTKGRQTEEAIMSGGRDE